MLSRRVHGSIRMIKFRRVAYSPHQLRSRKPQKLKSVCASNDEDQPDLIERIFGRLFGVKALEERSPGGMKRMSEEALLEQYPATLTEFAEPVSGDDDIMASFRPLLAQTRLQKLPLRLAYSAEEHGWSSSAFHDHVNTYGAAVIIAQTAFGAVCGGYNPRGWIGLGEDRNSLAAFLFTWPDGNTSKPAIKLPKVGGAGLAVMDDPKRGIQFGAEGLSIPLTAGSSNARTAKSRLGTFYAKNSALPERGRSLFSANDSLKGAELVSLKAYVALGEAEQWRLDGIVWQSQN